MKSLLTTLSILFVLNASAQGVFRDVTATQFGDSILLNWTLTAGNTCFDMHLQRAENDGAFANIYSIGGICGGTDDQYYDFIDSEELKSGTRYTYRITASNDTYISDTVSLTFLDAGVVDVFMYPNPATSMVTITVDNAYTPTFLLEIFSLDGRQVQIGQRNQNIFDIDTTQWLPGTYLVKITTRDGQAFAVPFIVL